VTHRTIHSSTVAAGALSTLSPASAARACRSSSSRVRQQVGGPMLTLRKVSRARQPCRMAGYADLPVASDNFLDRGHAEAHPCWVSEALVHALSAVGLASVVPAFSLHRTLEAKGLLGDGACCRSQARTLGAIPDPGVKLCDSSV